ncbi:plastocyanin/azurin family copper-binding protein [Chitinophaga sp. RCC_12]|uniref:plastocyanin/azurin family copper-binding protein n=1 Tax=Chitinophaga sp. RCC_12 TaxID=3239226 RepID=UPI00352391C4
MRSKQHRSFLLLLWSMLLPYLAAAQQEMKAREGKYYAITDVPIPDSVALEVGGLAFTPDDKLGVATRHGEIWLITDPYQKKSRYPHYARFAAGMHETLGLAWHNGSFYTTQRSELTRVTDTDKDGKADLFQTVASWPLSGNYHEYSYGPLFLPNGDMIVTLNLSWIGRGASLTKWRGWMMQIKPDGTMKPFAGGMRSPAGFGLSENGDIFFAENQGDWIGSGRITQLDYGDFAGHPAGMRWSGEYGSPLHLKPQQFPDSIGILHDFARKIPHFKEPSVWFPHTLMGTSTSAVINIDSDAFGPFKGQLLVGDQGHSKVMRAFLEKVNGKYQGACFPFLEGFSSGVLRLVWGSDHSLFVGMTSRGWASTGPAPYGLQRVNFKGNTPFEIKAMRAQSNGFELEFTSPVNKKQAVNNRLFQVTGFTYSYHSKYGSPVINSQPCAVVKSEVSDDGRRVRIYVEGLREGYIHALDITGLQSQAGVPLLHNTAYYTLNAIPAGSGGMPGCAITPKSAAATANNNTACGSDPSKCVNVQPASWTKGPDVVLKIGTLPGLKFDPAEVQVPAGSKVKLVFNNNDDMLHNLVIVKPGKGDVVGKLAMDMGLNGSQLAYVPRSADVLFNTCLLQPETSQGIYFIAPATPGNYPYVCTFPGHYTVMKGILKVVKK